jgi:hypothetical protein
MPTDTGDDEHRGERLDAPLRAELRAHRGQQAEQHETTGERQRADAAGERTAGRNVEVRRVEEC